MKYSTIVAFYESENSAQKAVNDLITDGFNENDISLIMRTKEILDNNDQLNHLENNELFEETDEQFDQPGTIRAIASVTINANDYEDAKPTAGEIVIGGPLMEEVNDLSEEEEAFVEDLLLSLGIPYEDIEGYLGMIEGGDILLSIEVSSEESAEYVQIMANHGPTVIEVFDEE